MNINSKHNVDIRLSAHNAFLELTFIRYAQNRKIEKPNNVGVCEP
jgi:hypothetical protein